MASDVLHSPSPSALWDVPSKRNTPFKTLKLNTPSGDSDSQLSPMAPGATPSPSSSALSSPSQKPSAPSWGFSFVVTLGSGISATAVGVHMVAYASPWLPSLDLSLLLRLDWGFLAAAAPATSSPVAAASAAGLLGSSLAAADVLGGRVPLLFLLCVATTIILVSFLASSATGSSLISIPLFAVRNAICCATNIPGRSFAKGANLVPLASAVSAMVQVLRFMLGYLKLLLAPVVSAALIPLMIIPNSSKSSRVKEGPETESVQAATSQVCRPVNVDDRTRALLPGLGETADLASSGEYHQRRGDGDVCCSSRHPVSEGTREVVDDDLREGDMGPGCVSEMDLEDLVSRLELREVDTAQGSWEMIVDKTSSSVDYCAWRRDPQDGGPTEYKTWTRFYGCTAQHLCAFYLDCDHLRTYETMIRSYDNLGFNKQTGQETGRMVKKYPLCSPREYILGWRVWTLPNDGPSATHFCVTKAVEHPLAPRTSSIRRIESYRSSWRIREVFVEGAGWCAEIDMYLQEDCGMQRSMAKLAFRRSIWGYIQTTDIQLRLYPLAGSVANGRSPPPSVQYAKRVPAWIRKTYLADTTPRHIGSMDMRSLSLPSRLFDGALEPLKKSPGGSLLALPSASTSEARIHVGHVQRSSRKVQRPVPETSGWSTLRRRAFPVLAAAAGIGTMTIARGPVGLAAKVLVACAVRVLAAEHNAESRKQPLRLARQRSRSKSMRQTVKYTR